MHASIAYTADDCASRSGRANVQPGATLYLPWGAATEIPDMSVEIDKRARACWMRIRRYLRELYDQLKVALSFKTRMVKAEASEALLYGWSTWTNRQEHYAKLRTVHHRVLLLIIGAQRKRPDHRMTSYNHALGMTRCKSIETKLRTRILFVGWDAHPNERRAAAEANRAWNFDGTVQRGRCGKEKDWTDCVQSVMRAFGIAWD